MKNTNRSTEASQSEGEQKRKKVKEIPIGAQRGTKGALQINSGFAARICLRKNPSQVRSLEGVVLGEREV